MNNDTIDMVKLLRFSINMRQEVFDDKDLEELYDEEQKLELKAEIEEIKYDFLKYYQMNLVDDVDSGVINGDDLR